MTDIKHKCNRHKKRRTRRLADLVSHEPFRETVDAYVRNLIAGTSVLASKRSRPSLGDCDLLVDLVVSSGSLPVEEAGKLAEGEFRKRLKAVARTWPQKRKTPPAPRQPVERNVGVLARLFGLDEVDRHVLQFVLVHDLHSPLRELTSLFEELSVDASAKVIAAAAVLPEARVLAALQPAGRLFGSGLIDVVEGLAELSTKVSADPRLHELAFAKHLDREKVMDSFLPTASDPSLGWPDFDHVAAEAGTARELLAAALRTNRPGMNVLFYGPTGTGKTELARLIARDLSAPLYVTGSDEGGESPKWSERLAELRLGNCLVGGTSALLLFDELEDLFKWEFAGHSLAKRGSALMSKQWFNELLETNPAPTIWISNEVDGVDAAFLRRFTYAIEMPPLSARQRARVLKRHLGEPAPLTSAEVDAVAQRFDASPAQLGSAVSAARLLSPSGSPDRGTIERVLTPVVKLVTGVDAARQVHFDPSGYRIDALNSPDDLAGIAEQLAGWKASGGLGVSMCLYGPSGTGKSEFVKYVAHRMGRRIVYRRVSDLQSMWVGQCEKNIARAFREAEQDEAVLLFDEADSFLRDRRQAHASWEATQVNEFLQQLEVFRGVVACTTNLWTDLDPASLRRFVFKVEFQLLRPAQSVGMFRSVFVGDLAVDGDLLDDTALGVELGRVAPLGPGDFAAVARRLRALGRRPTSAEALALLRAEAAARGVVRKAIGY